MLVVVYSIEFLFRKQHGQNVNIYLYLFYISYLIFITHTYNSNYKKIVKENRS